MRITQLFNLSVLDLDLQKGTRYKLSDERICISSSSKNHFYYQLPDYEGTYGKKIRIPKKEAIDKLKMANEKGLITSMFKGTNSSKWMVFYKN